MVKIKIDMTGWIMSEHGVPDSRLTIIEQAEDYISPQGIHYAQWICECSCEAHNRIVASGNGIRQGVTLSCGCLQKERAVEANRKMNKFDLTGEYGIGWTLNTNKEFYFDLEDYDKIKDLGWIETKQRGYTPQLMAHIPGTRKPVRMHVWIGFKGYDHIDRNELNNRRSNFREATVQENARNGSKRRTNTSGYIGVTWNKRKRKWFAQIMVNYKTISLGYFDDKEDAIRARLLGEVKYFGEFAPQRHLYEQYGIKEIQNN